jgi:hypothetical protein
VRLARNGAQRRFAALWSISTAIKIAALAVFLAVLFTVPGVPKP